jgi:hypothetical protein
MPQAEATPGAAPGRVKVRVTMFRDPIEVDPREVSALRRQGLLAGDENNPGHAPATAAAAAKPGDKGAGAPGKDTP